MTVVNIWTCAWCGLAFGFAGWFRYLRHKGKGARVAGTLACLAAVPILAVAGLLLLGVSRVMVLGDPDADHAFRRDLFLVAAATFVAGASSLHSGITMWRSRGASPRIG
jgi:hypothetical protein